MRARLYPSMDVAVVVFSIDQPESFRNVSARWVPELSTFCEGVPIILVCAKADLRNDKQTLDYLKDQGTTVVTHKEGLDMKNEVGAREYLECSSLTGEGVREVFHTAISTVLPPQPLTESKQCTVL
eukprot:TRINITY_DN7593_c0_g1_i1.p1 TRINITY_DN7593_c0_g1~~TRINITY_DN7593_c0_g1_i1.p1  ORF type:complete len:126 (+),score=21.18 TRINITY_DN7593_c0_g1_i1:435-812(+)